MTDQKAPAPAEQAGADDETLWNDLDKAEAGEKQDAPPDDQGRDDAFEGEAEATDQNASPDGPDIDEGQSTDKPADNAGEAEEKPDVWANAPPELREAYDELQRKATNLEHQTRSDRGRLSALQRKIAEMEQTVSKPAQAKADELRQGDGQQANATSREKRLEQLREEYPELAEPLIEYIRDLETKVAGVDEIGQTVKQLQTVEQSREQAYISQQEHTLSQTHPDWQPVLQNNGATFQAWIEDQPKAIREAAMRNANQIVDAQAAADVIARFKQHLGMASAQPQQAQEAEPKPKLNDKRQRQMDALASPRGGRGRPVASGVPEDADPEAIWDAFDALEARQSR